MSQLDWGKGIGLHFANDGEYYETLGYLANHTDLVSVYTHDNDVSGAWAGQGKLQTNIDKILLPDGLKRSFDLSHDDRLSVTEYVKNLIDNHSFTNHYDPTGNRYTFYRTPSTLSDVRRTVPTGGLSAFDRGCDID